MWSNSYYLDGIRAKRFYKELIKMAGNAEFVTEEAIINDLGEEALYLLRIYQYIECCGRLCGKKIYAI